MEIVHDYTAPPACCWLCSFTKQRPDIAIIDTGINVWDPDNLRTSQQGRVYFCQECVTNLGHLIGMVTPEEVHDLTEAAAASLARSVELEAEINALRKVRQAVAYAHAIDKAEQPPLEPAREVVEVGAP